VTGSSAPSPQQSRYTPGVGLPWMPRIAMGSKSTTGTILQWSLGPGGLCSFFPHYNRNQVCLIHSLEENQFPEKLWNPEENLVCTPLHFNSQTSSHSALFHCTTQQVHCLHLVERVQVPCTQHIVQARGVQLDLSSSPPLSLSFPWFHITGSPVEKWEVIRLKSVLRHCHFIAGQIAVPSPLFFLHAKGFLSLSTTQR
jgi:hypothetical protein